MQVVQRDALRRTSESNEMNKFREDIIADYNRKMLELDGKLISISSARDLDRKEVRLITSI